MTTVETEDNGGAGAGLEDRLAGMQKWWKSGMAGVVGIALGTVVVHLATGWRYGFDRDELMALEDARHLAWGYVQYPPMTAFFAWVALKLFGTSLGGFRFFAAVVQAVAVVLTGLMARELGGGRWAQMVAALAGVPFCLGGGALMQYISFDYVCWVAVEYCTVRVLKETEEKRFKSEKVKECKGKNEEADDTAKGESKLEEREEEEDGAGLPHSLRLQRAGTDSPGRSKDRPLHKQGEESERWWLAVGAGIGLGMMAKYTMGLLAAGVVAGVLLTSARRYLKSGWLWGGVLVAVAIFLPNLVWEWKRNFVSLEFLRFIHERDVQTGVTNGFFLGQLELTMLALPLAVAGLWFYFAGGEKAPASEGGRYKEEDVAGRYRALGWMYVVPLVLLVVMRGRDFYLAPAYPMLYAAGAVWAEKKSGEVEGWKSAIDRTGQWVRRVVWIALTVDVVVAGVVALPIAPVNSWWWKEAAKVDIVFPEEIGWEEFVGSVAQAWERLPKEEKTRAGILAGNYGEVGALNLYGERYGLPRAIGGVNSSWERGYGEPAPETVIVAGYPREFLEQHFASCEVGGRTWNKYGVANEETVENPEIFVCRGLKESWEEFWRAARRFA
jgi:hypothetical protein